MQVTVIGGGLAGSEAAWQLAEAGLEVRLLEMRPVRPTPVHLGGSLAELVCSNSLRAASLGNAVGLLKHEMEVLGSLIMRAAHAAAVPAGGALAVDRDIFAAAVTTAIEQHPRIVIERRELVELPVGPAIIATGPLTSPALHAALESLLGEGSLAFFDAIAPIVAADSLDHARLFRASRYDKGAGDDYLNAPMDKATYERFVAELLAAEKVPLRQFENEGPDAEGTKAAPATCPVGAPAAPVARYFEACLPIEVMAERGVDTLRFGPMKPVGLIDPATGHRPWAVVQLRQDDLAAEHWNLVGFQTKLTFAEQRRVFRMIPGLEHARFVRLGMIHRNTFINAPAHLDAHLRLATHLTLRLAGQLTGVEGYVESAATGLLAGRMLATELLATELLATELPAGGPSPPPADTACGGLIRHLTERPARGFQPANISWGLIAHAGEHGRERNRARRRLLQAEHALRRIREWGEATAGAALGEPQLAPPLDRPAGSE